MPREILGDVVSPSVTVGTRKWYTVPVSITCHLVILGLLVTVPLWSTNILPLPGSVMAFSAPLPPHTPPTPRPPVRTTATPQPIDIDVAPLEAPPTLEPEPPPQPTRTLTGTGEAVPSGPIVGTGPTVTIEAPPKPAPAMPMRVGGLIQPPRLLTRVDPTYPTVARNARLQGSVVLEATIARDGTVKDLRLLKSAQPLLDKAALEAVARWKYSPTTLNGDAVEVLLSVTVTFSLQ
jgi:protein TonB